MQESVPVAKGVDEDGGLAVEADLCPGYGFHQLVERAVTAGERDERIR